MATFPVIHPEKCPYCGKDLKLVTAKYEWDYYYACTGCGEKYPTKNGKLPDMQEVRNSYTYKCRTGSAGPNTYTAPTPAPTPAPVVVNPSVGFTAYTVKTFNDTRNNGQFTSAGTQLQQYLNSNRISRDRIVSISTSMYSAIQDILVITLVHC